MGSVKASFIGFFPNFFSPFFIKKDKMIAFVREEITGEKNNHFQESLAEGNLIILIILIMYPNISNDIFCDFHDLIQSGGFVL